MYEYPLRIMKLKKPEIENVHLENEKKLLFALKLQKKVCLKLGMSPRYLILNGLIRVLHLNIQDMESENSNCGILADNCGSDGY